MTVYFEEEGELKLELDCEQIADTVVEGVLDYENCPYEAEVNLLLTMNKEIQEMNAQFREIDRATDVLSFPMIDFENTGEFDFLEEDDSYFNCDTGELMLGDIVISKEKVIAQAEEYGHTIKREYAFLIAHSMLHLLGYDHMGELMLGDIVISKEKVIAQAEEYGHTIKREYAFLIAHSMLHLLGYDHMEEQERLEMERKQKEILEQLGITR